MINYLKLDVSLCEDWIKTRRAHVNVSNFLHDPGVQVKITIGMTDPENLKPAFHHTDEDTINLAGCFPANNFIGAEFLAVCLPGSIIKPELNYDLGVNSAGIRQYGLIQRTIDLKEGSSS